MTFDLTGLPPTTQEIDAFLADQSPDAEARVVDRLLESPRFGEHWGRHWLDVARYADSNGSDFNATFFNAWRYRNYVIDAFNRDKPFDRFVREQLAGDLLPYDNDQQRAEQLIATSFLMIGAKMLSERDKEKLTMDVVDEQIDTTGLAFLGLTLGCARCHDHKFDPVPATDYYALAGIFASTVTLEGESQQYVSAWTEYDLPVSPEHAAALAEYEGKKKELTAQVSAAKKRLQAAEKASTGDQPWNKQGVLVDDAEAQRVGNWKASTYSPTFVGVGYVHDDNAGKGQKSITFTPDLPRAGEYDVRLSYTAAKGRASNVPVTVRHAGGERRLSLNQEKKPKIHGLFHSLGSFSFEAGDAGSVTISNAGAEGHVIADAVWFVPVDAPPADADEKTAKTATEKKTPEKKTPDPLATAIQQATRQLKDLEGQLKQLEADAPPPRPKAMAVRDAQDVGDCPLRIRGETHKQGPMVKRGFLTVATTDNDGGGLQNPRQSGRAELAEWVAGADNPLTARVITNRVWQHLLGEGLVRSVDNFGHLGEAPTHPQLLDTLAVDLVESGWSIKSLVRRIALSRTYRMSCRHDERAFAVDPENRLLWSAHRKRLPAEAIRDAMLAISGRLNLSPGESPVEGLGRLAIDNTANQQGGVDSSGVARRSVYLPIVRNNLPEFLVTFDFADPDLVTGRRPVTNVPAQALLMLNSPFVRQNAAATAERLLAKKEISAAERIDRAYSLVLGRPASAAERRQASQFLGGAEAKEDADAEQDADAWREFVQALFASTEFRLLD